jgi:hypothetical protein
VPLTSCLVVELPGIEPASLPGKMPSELRFRYVSFRFSPARYLRVCTRLLTASRVDTPFPSGKRTTIDEQIGIAQTDGALPSPTTDAEDIGPDETVPAESALDETAAQLAVLT